MPVHKKGSIAGYIYAKIDVSAFTSTYFKPDVVGNNTLITLVGANGTTVASAGGIDFADEAPSAHPVAQFDGDAGIDSYLIGAEPYVTGYQKTADSHQWITVSILESEVLAAAVQARNYSLLFAVAIVIASTLILLILIRTIVRPIHTARQALEDLDSGKGDLTIRLDVCSNDEVADMALHFNHFADTLHDLFLKIRSAAHNLADSTGQISDQSRSNSSTAEKQSTDIDGMAKAITELSSSALQVAELAQDGATTVHEVNDEVENGLTVISDTESSINDLADDIENSEQMVNKLMAASSDINAVVDVINSVAEQTNLLALNAAIEAARAGEMGRGFAVVADEVRVLAQRTQSSAGEIKNTVDILQQQTLKVQHNFEKSRDDVSTTVKKAGAARDVFNTITEAFNKIDGSNSHIASASKEQSIVIDDISKNISQITELSDDTSKVAVRLLNETNLQEQAISSLNAVVDRFKVGQTEIAGTTPGAQKKIF
ncbi:MAG: methyl-accepting chemotaxis protein [Gammaproteobacteria bacterium]|nr:methyl-accepting chemotaxis protein [Gammaproteobacteria bacterium]